MSAKILLVGIDLHGLNDIRKSLTKNDDYKFFEAYNTKDALAVLQDHRIDLVVFDFDDISEDKINSILSLRDDKRSCPIVLLGNKVNEFALEILRVFPNILVLEKPHALNEVVPVTSKLISGQTVLQRKHKRFSTSQFGKITIMSDGIELDCTVKNLSKGGVFVEALSPLDRIDGLIKIHINLDEIQKDYSLSGRIVWSSRRSDIHFLGIQFIRGNDIYAQFLKNF